MRTFIELHAKGGSRLIVDTSAILGVMTAPGATNTTLATPESPITLILRDAAPVEIIAVEPAKLLGMIIVVKMKADQAESDGKALPVMVEWLEAPDEAD